MAAVISAATLSGAAAASDGLNESVIRAFVAAKNDATLRQDWRALRADYLPTAQIVGLYYDRSATPHVHDGPAATDLTTTAALMTKRHGFGTASVVSQLFISPGGQRATVTVVVTTDYEAGGSRVHRLFDDTMILEMANRQPSIAQEISVERPPG